MRFTFTTAEAFTALALQHTLDRIHEQKRLLRAQLEALDIARQSEERNLARLLERKPEAAPIKWLEQIEAARQEKLAEDQKAEQWTRRYYETFRYGHRVQ